MDRSEEHIYLHPQWMAALRSLTGNGCATVGTLKNDFLCKAPVGLAKHNLKANKN